MSAKIGIKAVNLTRPLFPNTIDLANNSRVQNVKPHTFSFSNRRRQLLGDGGDEHRDGLAGEEPERQARDERLLLLDPGRRLREALQPRRGQPRQGRPPRRTRGRKNFHRTGELKILDCSLRLVSSSDLTGKEGDAIVSDAALTGVVGDNEK